MKNNLLNILIMLICLTFAGNADAQSDTTINQEDKLVVLWTSGDVEVAKKMVFMYTYNAVKYKWWQDVTLLIWGPSQKLLTENEELQGYVKKMKEIGIHLLACKACADSYELSEELEALGVEVRYTGTDLTGFIKGEAHLVTL